MSVDPRPVYDYLVEYRDEKIGFAKLIAAMALVEGWGMEIVSTEYKGEGRSYMDSSAYGLQSESCWCWLIRYKNR